MGCTYLYIESQLEFYHRINSGRQKPTGSFAEAVDALFATAEKPKEKSMKRIFKLTYIKWQNHKGELSLFSQGGENHIKKTVIATNHVEAASKIRKQVSGGFTEALTTLSIEIVSITDEGPVDVE